VLRKKLRILSPNDFQEKGWLLSRILNSKGCPANSFTYPQNGLDEIEKIRPYLLSLYLNFSKASILRILHKLRENNPSLPIFICSNSATEQFKNQTTKRGDSVFLPKGDVVRRPPVWVEQISDQMKELSLTIRKRGSLPR
jgi:DNA-binding response OmpR family regulator